MPPVFYDTYAAPPQSFEPSYPIVHDLLHEYIENSLGDGYVQIISHETAFTRAGGGHDVTPTVSYKGLNKFVIQFNKRLKGADAVGTNLWKFFRDRLDNNNEAFYFYNPEENLTVDASGVSEIGRYLVRLQNPQQAMSRSFFVACAFNYQGIALIEERT